MGNSTQLRFILLVLLLSPATVNADTLYPVNANHVPHSVLGHKEQNQTNVNNTGQLQLLASNPATPNGKVIKVLFNDNILEKYRLFKTSSVQWQQVSGSMVNCNEANNEPDCPPPLGGGENPCDPILCSPILIDLQGDGIHMGEKGVGVDFDINADGTSDYIQWVKAGEDEAFLVLDMNENGVIDNGSELFGSATPLILDGGQAADGFSALAQFDGRGLAGNGDGRISHQDWIWQRLALWNDGNADGVSSADEIVSLDEAGIAALATTPKTNNRHDSEGNWIPLWAWATKDSGKKVKMVDVYFAVP